MQLIEESVKSLSGRAFRRIIRMYTNSRLRSIGSGALVTALLQRSSVISLMVLADVGAGVMNMQNAIGVIMGSNIGTTLAAWIITTIGFKIKIEALALPFIGLGAGGLILFEPSFTRCSISWASCFFSFPGAAVAIVHKGFSGLQNHPYRLSRPDTSGDYGCRHGRFKKRGRSFAAGVPALQPEAAAKRDHGGGKKESKGLNS
jgi:Na+/Pi-cotransporter